VESEEDSAFPSISKLIALIEASIVVAGSHPMRTKKLQPSRGDKERKDLTFMFLPMRTSVPKNMAQRAGFTLVQ